MSMCVHRPSSEAIRMVPVPAVLSALDGGAVLHLCHLPSCCCLWWLDRVASMACVVARAERRIADDSEGGRVGYRNSRRTFNLSTSRYPYSTLLTDPTHSLDS